MHGGTEAVEVPVHWRVVRAGTPHESIGPRRQDRERDGLGRDDHLDRIAGPIYRCPRAYGQRTPAASGEYDGSAGVRNVVDRHRLKHVALRLAPKTRGVGV